MTRILMVFADPEQMAPALPLWTQVVPEVPSAEWPWTVEKVRYSATWDLLPKLEEPGLVHICRPYTRAGELALIAAKVLRKRIVISDLEPATSAIGVSLGMAELADCVVCRPEESRKHSHRHRAEILDLDPDRLLVEMSDIYRGLMNGTWPSK